MPLVPVVVIGKRSSGETRGIWIAAGNANADTDPQEAMLLSLTQDLEQLILMGSTTSLPATVPLGLANTPFVLLNATNLTASVALTGNNAYGNYSAVSGLFMRPYPPANSTAYNVYGEISPSQLKIYGALSVVAYAVYRRRVR